MPSSLSPSSSLSSSSRGTPAADKPAEGAAADPRSTKPYTVPRPVGPIDLWLDGNEGPPPAQASRTALAAAAAADGQGLEVLRRYPDAGPLRADLAARFAVPASRLWITAGADEGIDRFCRAVVRPGQEVVVLTPGFEMVFRYVALAGGRVRTVAWTGEEGGLPVDAILAAVTPATAAVVLASPANPTGAVAEPRDVCRLAGGLAARGGGGGSGTGPWLLLDLVYAEFQDSDPTPGYLDMANVCILRSFSKGWGLAGLRVGFAIAPEAMIEALACAGGPYSVAAPSLLTARAAIGAEEELAPWRARIAAERDELAQLLRGYGVGVPDSGANFVLARTGEPRRARWLWEGLAGSGIATRRFADRPELADAIRITCPGDLSEEAVAWARLRHGIESTLAPQALLFDLDGVLADVHRSYRRAIVETAASFGVPLSRGEVSRGKAAGNATNDWELTRRLLAARGVESPLEEVTARFESIYQGSATMPGLRERETLCVGRDVLARLAARLPLAVVTGRPRRDAERFLATHGIGDSFATVVCMEDAPSKPAPEPLQLALKQLSCARAWFLGDTVDDIAAARAAGVVPLGIAAPGEEPAAARALLGAAGAARVLQDLAELEELLP